MKATTNLGYAEALSAAEMARIESGAARIALGDRKPHWVYRSWAGQPARWCWYPDCSVRAVVPALGQAICAANRSDGVRCRLPIMTAADVDEQWEAEALARTAGKYCVIHTREGVVPALG